MASTEVVAIGDGNLEWKGTGYQSRLKAARISEEDPLKNLHKVLVALAPSIKQIRRDSTAFVYVISDIDGEFSKIGYAYNAPKRLASLQTGSPKKLYIHRSFIFTKLSLAKKVEFWSHTIAAERHTRLEGEWFRCTPSQAHTAIEDACKEVGCGYGVATPTFLSEKTFLKGIAT